MRAPDAFRGISRVAGGEPGAERLHREPDLEKVVRLVGGQSRHETAAAGRHVEKPLGLKHPERFPDRVARHAELLGQPVLDQSLALPERAV